MVSLIWGRADRPNSLNHYVLSNNGNYNSTGHAKVNLNAGEHQVILWNKNTGGVTISYFLFYKRQ